MQRVMSAKIRGQLAPAPRLTRWGVLAILVYLGLPLLAALALVGPRCSISSLRGCSGRCYGLLCWLG